MDFVEVTEGNTHFLIPRQDATQQFPPGSAPVFYNPRMEMNRDATIALLSLLRPRDYLDAMGASGVRGIRAARECGAAVTINDRDPCAIDLISKNTAKAGIEAEVTREDVNLLLASRRFDAIDLDPFGTPAPFIDAAVRSARRFLFVTATDTAPLCGAHLKAGIRRYLSRPMNTEYHAEVGLRTLLGFVARETAKYDRGIEPLFCFAREHFVRLHLRLSNNATSADRALTHIGYILQCPHCHYREEEAGVLPACRECRECGAALAPIGPLWLGEINDRDLLARMAEEMDRMQLGTRTRLKKLLIILQNEIDTSSHYDYHAVAKSIKVSPARREKVLESLRAGGYRASAAHYSGTAIKTDAPLAALRDAISVSGDD